VDLLADTIQPFPTFSEAFVNASAKLRRAREDAVAAAPSATG
jgi:hypothetical protein